jgi:hypothetical protein
MILTQTKRRNRTANPLEVHDLKQKLRTVRSDSLEATRRGDFRRVAKLTAEAGAINRAIMEAQGLLQLMP